MRKHLFYRSPNTILIVFTLFSPILSFGQDILWEKSYGGRHAEYLMDAQPTADYGFILAGSSLSGKTGNKNEPGNGDLDYWVWKMSEGGELDWQKSFGGTGTDMLHSIRLTNDGGFFLAGTSNSPKSAQKKDNSRGGDDFWIIKLNAGGGEEWQQTIGSSGQEKLQSVYPTKDGGYILGGSSPSGTSGEKNEKGFGNLDYWVVKLDHEGKIEWQKVFGGSYLDELRSIEQTFDSGYIIGGYSNSSNTGNKSDKNIGIGDYWILKLDSKGEIEWQKTLGGDRDDQLYAVHQTYDGNYLLGGNSNSNSTNNKTSGNSNGTDFWVVKLDLDGNTLWQETYNIGKVDVLTSIVENKDHTILLGGFAKTEIINTNKKKDEKEINDYVLIKISEKGEEAWRKSAGSDGEDILRKVIETRDGGYILAGTSDPTELSSKTQKNTGGKKGNKNSFMTFGNDGKNKREQKTTSSVNDTVKEIISEANKAIDKETSNAAKKINDGIGLDKDYAMKYGLNSPNSSIKSPLTMGGGDSGIGELLPSEGQQLHIPASGNKAKSYGNKDFWVVKIGDKSKPTKSKASIETIPNPARDFTNVIIGYDYTTGTATIVDIAGHTLNSFTISGRTVPVDMSRYPDGVYVINIKTEKGNEGVKVIKAN